MKFSIKDFFSKCDQIRIFLRIWSHLLKKSLRENFVFCDVISNIFGMSMNAPLSEHPNFSLCIPLDTGCRLTVYKIFRTRPFHFLYPLKTSENQSFSVFSEYGNVTNVFLTSYICSVYVLCPEGLRYLGK